jgi:hypothetical protein
MKKFVSEKDMSHEIAFFLVSEPKVISRVWSLY